MLAVARLDDTLYQVLLFLHITSVVVAFAPGFVWPLVSARLKKAGEPAPRSILVIAHANGVRVHGPALVLIGVFGFSLVMASDKAIGFGSIWVMAAGTIWLIMLGVVWGLLIPAEKKAAEGDEHAEQKLVPMFGGIMHLLFFVMLYFMIFQPGHEIGT